MTDIPTNDIYCILPPHPPELEKIDNSKLETQINMPEFIEGQFLYIIDIFTREMLVNAWNSITQLKLWDYMKKDTDSFVFSNDNEIKLIMKKMVELGYDEHSGCSFGWTMRQIQYIAINGEKQFANEIIRQNMTKQLTCYIDKLY